MRLKCMGRKKVEIYRIKDIDTGLYYNGGTGPLLRNELYDPKAIRTKGDWTGKHPWNIWYRNYWDNVGKLFTNKRGAELAVSRLSSTSVHMRKDKTKNILYGNQKSNNLKIVRCRIIDIKE